jgi:hypothetical protein
MATTPLEDFGRLLITRVRDEAIEQWDMILDGRMKDEDSQRLHRELRSQPAVAEALARRVPEIVDTTLHHLLWTLEQARSIEVTVHGSEGSVREISKESDGLPGELYGPDGWIARFSQQRHSQQ